jgi:predicted ATPase
MQIEQIILGNSINLGLTNVFQQKILNLIHLPGLRGNPERTYKITAVNQEFSGTFEIYIASIISKWQTTNAPELKHLNQALETLGVNGNIEARKINDVQIELSVSRLSKKGETSNQVSLADVGFGVSQILPVLVALIVAQPGQLVHIEQPEIHLHPRAQVALAQILIDAANRGVKVVIETHSELLLLAIQTLVAEGKLSPDLVKLHWFTRREDGVTEVNSADLDDKGAFGNWPEDFGQVYLNLESRYLDAAEARLLK